MTRITGSVPDDEILVRARAVTKRFGGLLAVNDVDFDIPRRSIVSLIGPNGAGKTTFFNMITGAYVPTSGEISFDGHPIDIPGVMLFEVVDGLVARRTDVWDSQTFLRQTGAA